MAERNTIFRVHMETPKDETKQSDTAGNADSQKKTPTAKVQDLRPEKDPMGAGGGPGLTTKPPTAES